MASSLVTSCREARVDGSLGMSRLGVLILVLIIAAGVFVGSQVFPFFYYYYELEGLMQAQAEKASEFSDEEIRKTVIQKIKKLEIPFDDPDDVKINRFDGKIVIEYAYSEVLFLEIDEDHSYDLYTFHFHPRAEMPLGRKR